MSSSLVPEAYSSSILSRILLTSPLARSTAMSCLISFSTSANGLVEPGSILTTRTMAVAKRPVTGALTPPFGKPEGGVGDGGIDHLRLGDGAEIDVLVGQFPFRGQRIEAEPVGDLLRRRLRLRGIGEGDLLDLPALRNGIAALANLVGALGVFVADLDGLGELLGRHRQHHELAIFRRPECRLVARRNRWSAAPASASGCRRTWLPSSTT